MESTLIVGWLHGLAAMGCRFVELVRNGKRPRRTLDHYDRMTGDFGVQCALKWLANGSPVGIMPKPPLWILDADSPAQVERVVSELFDHGITPVMVPTPSGGAHFYGTLPDDFHLSGLKNHLPDGTVPMDYKFGPSTLVVCPGSVRKGIAYLPASEWPTPPPVIDPRWFKTDGFWHTRDARPFLTNQRPLKDRLMAARAYLKLHAPSPVRGAGQGAHRALSRVCCQLVAYHRIPPRTALTMMANWNRRFTDSNGKPCPYSRGELISALDAAGYSTPESGVKAYQRAEAKRIEQEIIDVHIQLIRESLTMPSTSRVPVTRVRMLLMCFGLDLSETAFGNALRLAGVPNIQFTQQRIHGIPGLDYLRLYSVLVERLLRDQGARAGRDLNKQEPALPKMCPLLTQVERGVSAKKDAA